MLGWVRNPGGEGRFQGPDDSLLPDDPAPELTGPCHETVAKNMTHKTLLLGLTGLILIGSLAFAQSGERTRDGRPALRERAHARTDRVQRLRQFARTLEFTEAQKAQALQAARAIQPVAQSARAEALRIVEQARAANPTGTRESIRAAVKEQLKTVRENAAAQIVPNGRALLASLTPAQRAKIEAALEKHGKTFDAERAAKRISWLLARPRAVQFLESRTGR